MFYSAEYPAKSKPYLAIIGRFARFAMCHRLDSHTSKDVAGAILERWVVVFERPREILSDRGSGMCGPEWEDMGSAWNIVVVGSTDSGVVSRWFS